MSLCLYFFILLDGSDVEFNARNDLINFLNSEFVTTYCRSINNITILNAPMRCCIIERTLTLTSCFLTANINIICR